MALMSYYHQTPGSDQIDGTISNYTARHTLNLEIDTSTIDDKELVDFFGLHPGNLQINAIIEEIPEIGYKTSWGDSPAAVLNDKIKKFTENKWMKMFAYQNPNYRPPLLTDGWTQQVPKAAEPLSISLKFRAYPINNYYNTTIYRNIIQYLIFATTPRSFQLTDTLEAIKAAYEQAYKKGEELGEYVDTLTNDLSNGAAIDFEHIATALLDKKNKKTESVNLTADERRFVNAINEIAKFMESLGNMNESNVGGCPLVNLGIYGLISNRSAVRWLIKSWSFKPSMNVTENNEPIYVDFNISLQTQYILSSNDMISLLAY